MESGSEAITVTLPFTCYKTQMLVLTTTAFRISVHSHQIKSPTRFISLQAFCLSTVPPFSLNEKMRTFSAKDVSPLVAEVKNGFKNFIWEEWQEEGD